MNGLEWAAASVMLALACWTDVRRMEIPNRLTVFFACGGFVYQTAASGFDGLKGAVLGAAAGLFPLLAMYLLRGIGGGDVKWFAAFGTWGGVWPVWKLMALSMLAAGGLALAVLIVRLVPAWRRALARIEWPWQKGQEQAGAAAAAGGTAFPFMLAVVPAFVWLAFIS
ncbi:A24 family peptidase [Cohnella zeiphila]|uniref:Prepilin peptidase n=1 Tax=Cohnella zeiphila TaxID=2761120 RepID=A0A7X0VWH9_9BACL|nr:A24 family peptidase [Cohnella zeiphila]MBB6730973.1 prepilin peptidase [Cohnella zeiphila]